MQALGTPKHASEGLDRHASEVVEGLLRRKGYTGSLGMEAHPGRALVLGAEAFPGQLVPDASRRTELGDLLEEVVVAVEEEGKAWREIVEAQAARHGVLAVRNP